MQNNVDAKELTKELKKLGKRKLRIGAIFLVVLLIAISFFAITKLIKKEPGKQEVVTISTLEKVIKTSSLSTYETVYNGVATVMNEDNKNIDYYVTYEATIKAGLDFNELSIKKDDEKHIFIVSIPPITLQDPTVAIEKLDYIIINRKVEKQGLIANAYSICVNDVKQKAKNQTAIYDYASQNAENLIKGLISPFIEQIDGDYGIEFERR